MGVFRAALFHLLKLVQGLHFHFSLRTFVGVDGVGFQAEKGTASSQIFCEPISDARFRSANTANDTFRAGNPCADCRNRGRR